MSRRLKILIGIAVGISVIGAVLCLGLHLNIKGILRSTQRTVIAGDYIQRMTQRANEGDPLAMFSLSLAYRKGKLVPKNERIAFDWLTKAADAGDVNAQNNLGAEYQFGGLVAKDIRRAFHWYEKASAQGHPTAQFNLAVHFY